MDFYQVKNYVLDLWYEPLAIAVIALLLLWVFAMILNQFTIGKKYASQDYSVSFFWDLSLILTTLILSLFTWGLYFGLFPLPSYVSASDNIWYGFAMNMIVFYIITVIYYIVRIRAYFKQVKF